MRRGSITLTPAMIDEQVREAVRAHDSDPQQAQRIAEELITASREINYPRGIALARRAYGMACGVQGDIVRAKEEFHAALRTSQEIGDALLEVQCRTGLAMAARHLGHYAEAVEEVYRIVAIRREIGEPRGLINSLNNLGSLLGELGNYSKAAEILDEALRLATEMEDGRGSVYIYDNLGLVYVECGELEKAETFFKTGIRMAEDHQDNYSLGNLWNNLSTIYFRTQQFSLSVEAAEKALSVANSIGNIERAAIALTNLANASAAQGNVEHAENLLRTTLSERAEAMSPTNRTSLQTALAELLWKTGRSEESIPLFTAALQTAQIHAMKQGMADIYKALADLYEEQGDHAAALAHYRSFHEAYILLQKESTKHRLIAQIAERDAINARNEAEIERRKNAELAAANRDKERLLAELQRLATHDALTGARNRRYADDFLSERLRESQENGTSLVVALGDMDGFKRINDTLGHAVGDRTLQVVALLLEQTVGGTGLVARFGGEEWLVVLPNTTMPEAVIIAAAAQQRLADYDWSVLHPDIATITMSWGIAENIPPHQASNSLLAIADARLYIAKREGKNRIIASDLFLPSPAGTGESKN